MDKKDLRIVYLGTPDFAVESLRRLVEGGYNIVGVVTMPDKPIGRHQNHLQPSPVKEYAQSVGLPILQPVSLKSEDFIKALRAWNADLQIVVAFRMLPEVVWNMPRLGTFNLHASLLPQYRGAAPINWAIINGECETGITTFFLKHDIDTGDIIDQVKVPILPNDDFGTIHDKLMNLGGDLVCKTVDDLLKGEIQARPQSEFTLSNEPLKPAPKIFRDTCKIQWNQPAQQIHDFIRGLSPAPTAWTLLQTERGEESVKIFRTERISCNNSQPAGTILAANKTGIDVATQDGALRITDLQIAGKKRMTAAALLNGFSFEKNAKFC